MEGLPNYRYSSYWYLRQPKKRPAGLQLATCLAEAGGLTDTPAGWGKYADYLEWQAEEGPVGKSKAYVSLSKGWMVGSAGFKTSLIKDHALAAKSRAWESHGAREIKEQAWEELVARALHVLNRTDVDVPTGKKSETWKVAVLCLLKEKTQASNPWLAERMAMGRPAYVSRLVSGARRGAAPSAELKKLRDKCTT